MKTLKALLTLCAVVFVFLSTISNAKQPTASRILKLHGAGSPLSVRVHNLLAKIYTEKNDMNGKITYDSTDSFAAFKSLEAAKLGFAAVETVVDTSVKDLQLIPFMAAPIVIAYHLPSNSSTSAPDLLLDRDTLVQIFIGNLTRWNDPRLQLLNPFQILPDQPIVRVLRGDPSGSTYILKSALESIDPRVKDASWNLLSTNWPNMNSNVKIAYTTQGASKAVFETPYSISYVTLRAAIENEHDYTWMKNSFGNIVQPNYDSVFAAMNETYNEWDEHFTKQIVDSDGADAWPLAGYTYIAYRPNNKVIACNLYVLLYNYLQWIYTSNTATTIMKQLHFVPLQAFDREAVVAKLHYMQCRGDYFYEPYKRNLRTGGVAFGFFVLFLFIVAIGVFIVFLVKGGAVFLYNKVTGTTREYPTA